MDLSPSFPLTDCTSCFAFLGCLTCMRLVCGIGGGHHSVDMTSKNMPESTSRYKWFPDSHNRDCVGRVSRGWRNRRHWAVEAGVECGGLFICGLEVRHPCLTLHDGHVSWR